MQGAGIYMTWFIKWTKKGIIVYNWVTRNTHHSNINLLQMHTIITEVVLDNLKACLRFVRRSNNYVMYAKWIPSIEIPLLGTG